MCSSIRAFSTLSILYVITKRPSALLSKNLGTSKGADLPQNYVPHVKLEARYLFRLLEGGGIMLGGEALWSGILAHIFSDQNRSKWMITDQSDLKSNEFLTDR